jgi:hypothetical protein
VPGTLEAAIVFALFIAPGFVFQRGYAARRLTRTLAERDLYALGAAVAWSIVLVAVAWLVFHGRLADWGVIPGDEAKLEDHQAAVGGALLAIVLLPFPIGWVAATLVNRSASWGPLARLRMFEPPTAWDAAWLAVRAKLQQLPADQRYVDLTVRLKTGVLIEGRYGTRSTADLSPRPTHQLFVETGYGYTLGKDDSESTLDAEGELGIYIEASEIAAIYFHES